MKTTEAAQLTFFCHQNACAGVTPVQCCRRQGRKDIYGMPEYPECWGGCAQGRAIAEAHPEALEAAKKRKRLRKNISALQRETAARRDRHFDTAYKVAVNLTAPVRAKRYTPTGVRNRNGLRGLKPLRQHYKKH